MARRTSTYQPYESSCKTDFEVDLGYGDKLSDDNDPVQRLTECDSLGRRYPFNLR